MPIDLLAVGEQLAELDLTVRQLDDGTLTVATDDSQPDGARVHLAGAGQGLRVWLTVATLAPGQGSRAAAALGPVNQELAAAGGRGALMVRGTEVRFEVGLDHPPPYTADELQALHRAVSEGGAAQRATVERVVGETAPTAVDGAAALPASFLRGAGQRPRETTTERFGAAGAVPGRSELQATTGASGSGGRGVGGVVLMVVGLAGLAAVGVAALKLGGAPEQAGQEVAAGEAGDAGSAAATATDAAATPPAPAAGAAPAEADDMDASPVTPAGESPPRTRQDATARARVAVTEEQVLAQVRDPAARLEAVEAWLREQLDRRPGARRRMLEALGDTIETDPKVGRLVMQSLRDRPPSVADAVECLDVARGGVKRALVQVLADADEAEVEAAAGALAKVEDTPDLVVEEALLKLGRPRAGAALRLATARGVDWVLYGDGQPLLVALARRDVKQLESLLQHGDVEVRMSACALIAGAEQAREALALLAAALRDPEPRVRERAAEGLTALKDPRASWPLARALTREDSNQTRDVIVDGLQRLPLKATVDLLGRLYASSEPNDRRAAVMGWNAVGRPEAITGLVAALRDADRTVRLEALRALDAAYGKPALRPRVAEGLASIRELGLDRSDREVWTIARQLHYQITGRMPDATVRDRGTR